jgi:hypothetical protein
MRDVNNRAKYKAKYPTLKNYKKLDAKMKEEWQILSDEEKKVFYELALKDKERYQA